MKKALLMSMLFVSAASVSTTNAFSGYFIGAGTGLNWLRGKIDFTSSGFTDSKRVSKGLFLFGIRAGYHHELSSRMILGGEAGFYTSASAYKGNILTATGAFIGAQEVKQRYSAHIAMTVGKLMNPKVFAYGKAGFEYTMFNFKYALTSGAQSERKPATTLFPGVGVQYSLSKNMALGLEYQFLGAYKKITTRAGGAYKPNAHRVMIIFNYLMKNLF